MTDRETLAHALERELSYDLGWMPWDEQKPAGWFWLRLADRIASGVHLGDEGLRAALVAIRDYDTGEPLTAADAGALQGIAAAALTEGDSR